METSTGHSRRRGTAPAAARPLARAVGAWLGLTPAEAVGLGVLLLGSVVASVLWWLPSPPVAGHTPVVAPVPVVEAAPVEEGGSGGPGPSGDPGLSARHDPGGPLTVHVTGAVVTPGLVRLSGPARAGDAVVAAGGLRPDADPTRINLARLLDDGEHVHVPLLGEDVRAGAVPAQDVEGQVGGGGDGDSRPIDLNTADQATLEGLPGIGPARAAAIIEHRRTHGPFTVPGELRAVPGIGEVTFQRLAPLVEVR